MAFYSFQVNITPKRKEESIKKEVEESCIWTLAPFQPNPTLEFNNVPTSSVSSKVVILKNPSNYPLKFSFESSDECISTTPTTIEINPKSNEEVLVTWVSSSIPGKERYTLRSNISKKLPHLIIIAECIKIKTKGQKITKKIDSTDTRRLTFITSKSSILSENKENIVIPIINSQADISGASVLRENTVCPNKETPNQKNISSSTLLSSPANLSQHFGDVQLSPCFGHVPLESSCLEPFTEEDFEDDSLEILSTSSPLVGGPCSSFSFNIPETIQKSEVKKIGTTYIEFSACKNVQRKKSPEGSIKSLSHKSVPSFKSRGRSSSVVSPGQARTSIKEKVKTILKTDIKKKLDFTVQVETSMITIFQDDPFSRAAVKYHTKEWLIEKENELIKWINGILTPPEEWEGLCDHHCINAEDIASIWERVSKGTVPLAPTKEALANKYADQSHLIALRKAALALYMTEEVVKVKMWIKAQISKKLIEVKNEIDLGKNQGSRVLLVQMLMRYNPLWLRLGLETIFNTVVPLHSYTDIRGMIVFIQRHLMSRDDLTSRISHQKKYSIFIEMQRNLVNEFILEHFLMLIFFLDLAKRKRLIPYDPCLFVKNAPVKESLLNLDEFIKEFLKCIGGLKSGLKRNGYILLYKQSALDEYNFSVKSWTDLRDGVCLARSVEIILKKNTLSPLLRVPANTILQKVNNIGVAIKALTDEGFSIEGNICSKDVAMGHREKIFSLLWQILNKFIKPRIEASAVKIQTWWRKKLLFVTIKRKIAEKKEFLKVKAAAIIQAAWRGHKVRKEMHQRKALLIVERDARRKLINSAVITVQRRWRATMTMRIHRSQFMDLCEKTRRIQSWYRACILMKYKRAKYLELRNATITIQQRLKATLNMRKEKYEYLLLYDTTVKIQKWYRACVVMKHEMTNYQALKQAVTLIQQRRRATLAMRECRSHYLDLRDKVVTVQCWYRACVEMKKKRAAYQALKKAAISIQHKHRANLAMRLCRNQYLDFHDKVVKIQCWYRACMIMKCEHANYLILKKAVINIQRRRRAIVKTRECRNEYLDFRKKVTKIQSWFRASIEMKHQRAKFISLKKATISIQHRRRATLAMRQCRSQYLELHNKIVKIQFWYRASLDMKKERTKYLSLKKAAITIQHRRRATVEMRVCRRQYLELCHKLISIQCWYRASLEMRKQRAQYVALQNAAINIQRRRRATVAMRDCRSQYVNLHNNTLKIQSWYRACCEMKNARVKYLALKEAAIAMQRRRRATVKMRLYRSEYLELYGKVVKIQCWYRACAEMKKQKAEYTTLKKTVTKIQQRYRASVLMKKCRSEYTELHDKTVKIQCWYRACISMKNEMSKYKTLKEAVLTIQRRRRATLEMRDCRRQFLKLQENIIRIQCWYRACSVMKHERANYLSLKKAALAVQYRWRAILMMREYRNQYLQLCDKIVKIQCWYRACNEMKRDKAYYLALKKAALTVQHRRRATLVMRESRNQYLELRDKIVKIQHWYRACNEMKRDKAYYLALKKAALTVQHRRRATVMMRECRNQYLELCDKIVKIQYWYRACIIMKSDRSYYLALKKSVITVQKKRRATVMMRECRNNYLNVYSKVVKIQRWFRASVTMKHQQNNYIALKRATIFIQHRFRATMAMRQCRSQYLELRDKVRAIQLWYRACMLMKQQRSKYMALKKTVIKIQCWRKATICMRECRSYYTKLYGKVVKIQRWYRACILMKRQRSSYVTLKMATIEIQHRRRATLAMRSQRRQFLEMRENIIKIQRWYLACVKMKSERLNFLALKSATFDSHDDTSSVCSDTSMISVTSASSVASSASFVSCSSQLRGKIPVFKKPLLKKSLPKIVSRLSKSEKRSKYESSDVSSSLHSVISTKNRVFTTNAMHLQYQLPEEINPFEQAVTSDADLEEKELELLRWIDAVVKPPEEWENVNRLSISPEDIALLWKQINKSQSNLSHQPSLENLSKDFVSEESRRLMALRNSANKFYVENNIGNFETWIREQIRLRKHLELKNDINLHKNTRSRTLVVQLLARYNPFWLRIGLETIFGESVRLNSYDDFNSFLKFIDKHLMSSHKIVGSKYYAMLSKLKDDVNNYILEKMFVLIYFLDRAKMEKLVPFDPSLFQERSSVTSSAQLVNDIVTNFCKCNCIEKMMKRNGYKLLYKQKAGVCTVDLSVSNRLDITDGVILTRAVEAILKDKSLKARLLEPVSQKAKVTNVKTALDALVAAGVPLSSYIQAEDIVAGNRLQILSLLWQILNRYVRPKNKAAAAKIIKWWRHCLNIHRENIN